MLGVQKNAVSKWECGRVDDVPTSKIKAMASLFGVPVSYLVDDYLDDMLADLPDNIFPVRLKKLPLLGEIACGEPTFAEEELDLYAEAENGLHADFCLRAKGDSMIGARIFPGDIVFVREQPTVENGDIAAVIIDNEATLKRVYINGEIISLVAENPIYQPIIVTKNDNKDIRILGKAIAFQSNIK